MGANTVKCTQYRRRTVPSSGGAAAFFLRRRRSRDSVPTSKSLDLEPTFSVATPMAIAGGSHSCRNRTDSPSSSCPRRPFDCLTPIDASPWAFAPPSTRFMKHLTDGIMLPFPDDDRTGGLIVGGGVKETSPPPQDRRRTLFACALVQLERPRLPPWALLGRRDGPPVLDRRAGPSRPFPLGIPKPEGIDMSAHATGYRRHNPVAP